MSGFDPSVVREWLYTTLSGDTSIAAILPGGWHRGTAPEGTVYPFGSFHLQTGGQDTKSISGRRILSNGLWMVRVTGVEGDSDVDLDAAAALADSAIDRGGGTAGTGRVYMATREQPWDRVYDDEGRTFVEAGGLYRIWVQDPAAG